MTKLITIKLTKEEVLAVQECCADAVSEVEDCQSNEGYYENEKTAELFDSAMTKIYHSIPTPSFS